MNYTIIGGRGFIGAKIVELLEKQGENVWVPERDAPELFNKELGTVIYCAGHGDCENGPLKVLEANTILLARVLERCNFDKLVYISSTRVYMGQSNSSESDDLTVLAQDSRRLFNLTKLVAEEILLRSNKNVAIVRPSNVYGLALDSPLFLPSIVRNAVNNGRVDMYVAPDYAKDYVSVDDVAEMTIRIAKDISVNQTIVNVAAGYNTTAGEIAKILSYETSCQIIWHQNEITEQFPVNDISKVSKNYAFKPQNVLKDLSHMINEFKYTLKGNI
jgi:nucleoside-diphosphate-sugar epimerase